MARLGYGGFNRIKGSAGDYTFRQVGSETIVSRRQQKRGALTSTPGRLTEAQMRQVTKIANIVNLWKRMRGAAKQGYPDITALVSSYNRFFGYNAGSNAPAVYLTKGQAQVGGAVVAPYIFTVGDLAPVEVSLADGRYSTNINMTDDITTTSTIGFLSDMLLSNNPSLQEGDQISFVQFEQTTDAMGVPRVTVTLEKIVLNLVDTRLVYDIVRSSSFQNNNGRLGTSQNVAAGGFVYVVSRRRGTDLLVSSQSIIVTDGSVYADFNTNAAYTAAEQSQGGVREDVFLDPLGNTPVYSAVELGQDTDQPASMSSFALTSGNVTVNQNSTTQVNVSGNIRLQINGTNLSQATAAVVVGGATIALQAGERTDTTATYTGTATGVLSAILMNGQTIKSLSPQQSGGSGGYDDEP